MSLDDKLTYRNIVWSNVLDGIKYDAMQNLFKKDYVIELNYSIPVNSNGYVKIDLSEYKVRAIMSMALTRYNDYRESVEVESSVLNDSYLVEEYALHGRTLIVKSDVSQFNLKVKFLGCSVNDIKEDIDNELKAFYISLLESNPNDIYTCMNRLKNSYENTYAENSKNIEVVKKTYSQVKLNRL